MKQPNKRSSEARASERSLRNGPGVSGEVAVEDINEAEEVLEYKSSITSYGADFPVDGLVRRLDSKAIIIPTFDPEADDSDLAGFQRQFIWTKNQCDRFIESLLLGLPVPGIFLVRQANGQLLVLDGQQRLKTLQSFYKERLRGQPFVLENVQSQYKGLSYSTLEKADQRRLDDSIIHATVVKQDEPTTDLSSVYLIFERLNTGGTSLHPQEIRVALYRGNFVELLRELNQNSDWRNLYGKKSARLKDQELILRFFALLSSSTEYQRPMKEFLNIYMSKNKDLSAKKLRDMKDVFVNTTHIINGVIGRKAVRLGGAVNAAVVDSVLVGVARRLSQGPIEQDVGLDRTFDQLVKRKDYLQTVERATADEESVSTRLRIATEVFSKVK